jgi:hypothetical protein
MSDREDHINEVLSMTSETIGQDILGALVTEIKLLPDVWQKLSEKKQNDVIDRLRARVEHNVKMAVHLIASEGRTVVAGDLDQITIKDGVKAVVKFSSAAANLHELYDCSGRAVLVVVANPAQHTGGIDSVKGESDQRAMDLGHEYDPNGDGNGMDDGKTIDVLVIENNPTNSAVSHAKVKTKNLSLYPSEFGAYIAPMDEELRWKFKKDFLAVQLLELEDGIWLWRVESQIGTEGNRGPFTIHQSSDSRVQAYQHAAEHIAAYNYGGDLKGRAVADFEDFINQLREVEPELEEG